MVSLRSLYGGRNTELRCVDISLRRTTPYFLLLNGVNEFTTLRYMGVTVTTPTQFTLLHSTSLLCCQASSLTRARAAGALK